MQVHILKKAILDHGYIKVIEHWGSDERIIEAARMSTDKGFLGWEPGACPACFGHGVIRDFTLEEECRACNGKGKHPGDAKLLRYLYTNRHDTPFEMAGLIIEVKAPLMVFREWHRHRTQSYNEMSARYVPLPNENYMPTLDRLMVGASSNKQASRLASAGELTEVGAIQWLAQLADVYEHNERVYQSGLELGVPKEIARLSMTVGRYSRMRASANLRNWLGFLTLRYDERAQWEIRQYAAAVCEFLEERFPRTMNLYLSEKR